MRLPQVGAPPLDAASLPLSFEGTEQRCFRRMYVCTNDVNPQRQQLHVYGQLLAEHYGAQQAQQQQQAPQVLPPPVSILRMLGRGGLKGERQLRIAFAKRATQDRQLVNVQGAPVMRVPVLQHVAALQVHAKSCTPCSGRQRMCATHVARAPTPGAAPHAELLAACNSWRYRAPSGALLTAFCWEVSRAG